MLTLSFRRENTTRFVFSMSSCPRPPGRSGTLYLFVFLYGGKWRWRSSGLYVNTVTILAANIGLHQEEITIQYKTIQRTQYKTIEWVAHDSKKTDNPVTLYLPHYLIDTDLSLPSDIIVRYYATHQKFHNTNYK